MRFSAALASLGFLLLAGCAPHDLYRAGDVLIQKSDGTVLGTVIEVGDHKFASGVNDRSVLVRLAKDPSQQNWYAVQVLGENYEARK